MKTRLNRRALLEEAKRAGLSRACVDVMLAIRRYELMPDGARPTIATIARDASVATRTASACVAKLESAGWVEVARKHREPSRYVSRLSLIVDHDQTARKKIMPSVISSLSPILDPITEADSLSPLKEETEGISLRALREQAQSASPAGTPPPLTLRQPAEPQRPAFVSIADQIEQLRRTRPAKAEPPAVIQAVAPVPEPAQNAERSAVSERSEPVEPAAVESVRDRWMRAMRGQHTGEDARGGAQDAPGRTETGQDDRR
jgi:DNA-binding MarR family transcriptional regulator